MTFEKTLDRFRPALLRIAAGTTSRDTLLESDDRYQEMAAHLWSLWRRGATRAHRDSYILQSCRFALRNRCRAFRRTPGARAPQAWEEVGEDRRRPHPRPLVPDAVNSRQLLDGMLSNGLSPRERAVVVLRREGRTLRETAAVLGTSHVWVLRLQDRIRDKWQWRV